MDIAHPALAVLCRGPAFLRRKHNHGHGAADPRLAQCRPCQGGAQVAGAHGLQPVAVGIITIDTGHKIAHARRDHIAAQRIERARRRRGAEALGVGHALRGPQKLSQMLQGQRAIGKSAHGPPRRKRRLHRHGAARTRRGKRNRLADSSLAAHDLNLWQNHHRCSE